MFILAVVLIFKFPNAAAATALTGCLASLRFIFTWSSHTRCAGFADHAYQRLRNAPFSATIEISP